MSILGAIRREEKKVTTDAIKATDTLMNGPYVGQDTHKRGYFGPGILDAQVKTLQAYYNAAHKHFYGQ